jgi:hypothetical protein
VGAGRRATAYLVDGIVWVQADVNEIGRRNAARVAAGEAERDGVAKWMAEEFPLWPNSGRGSGPSRSSREPLTYAMIPRPRSCLATPSRLMNRWPTRIREHDQQFVRSASAIATTIRGCRCTDKIPGSSPTQPPNRECCLPLWRGKHADEAGLEERNPSTNGPSGRGFL